MSKTPDHKSCAELLARQFNTLLKTEGLGAKARKDRKSSGHEARTDASERRQLNEMRRRPSYMSVEARQPLEKNVRLIRARDRHDTIEPKTADPERRPSFKEMRAEAEIFPAIPGEVHEHKRRKREQRRTAARVRRLTKPDSTKK